MTIPTILLLEGDDLTVHQMYEVFSKAQFDLVHAYSLQEAFQKIKTLASGLALVILDFELATDDVNIFERLRRLDFERPLPVMLMGEVMLSQPEIDQLTKDTGYAGYIYKSMEERDMLSAISHHATAFVDQRHYPRVFYRTKVHGVFEGKHYVSETFNISKGGLFLRLDGEMPKEGTKGTVTFDIGLDDEKYPVTMQVEVMFLRSSQKDVVSIYPPGVGLHFYDVQGDVQSRLESFITSKLDPKYKI